MKESQVEKRHQVRSRKFSLQEKTPDKVKAFPSTSLPAGQPHPNTPILSSLRSPSAPSRPRDSSKKATIKVVKVGGEDLYHVDEELSPVAVETDEEEWDDEEDEPVGDQRT